MRSFWPSSGLFKTEREGRGAKDDHDSQGWVKESSRADEG